MTAPTNTEQPNTIQVEHSNPDSDTKLLRWFGLGTAVSIVLSSVSYCIAYQVTRMQVREWFAVPGEERVVEAASPEIQPTTLSLMSRPNLSASDRPVTITPDVRDILLSKKSNFDRRVEEFKQQRSALKEQQSSTLQTTTDLDQMFNALLEADTLEGTQEKAEEILTFLEDASYQNTEIGRISRAITDLDQQIKALSEANTTTELQANLQSIKHLLQSLTHDESQIQKINLDIAKFEQRSHEQVRLLEQIEAVEQGIERHANLAIHYHSQTKAAILISILLSIVAGALGIIMGKDGWSKADRKVFCTFAILSITAVLFNQLPRTLKSEANFQNNQDLYHGYVALKNSVHSFVATEGGIGDDPQVLEQFNRIDTNRFIHSVDNKLAELNTLSIGIDSTQNIDIANALSIPSRPPQMSEDSGQGGAQSIMNMAEN